MILGGIILNVIILFGGISSEHAISCISAASVLRNIDRKKYTVSAVGITKAGRWFLYENENPDKIEDGSWEQETLVPAVLSPDRSTHGLLIQREAGVEARYVDCVFPVLHGIGGEDGTVQGLLTLAGIPFVGCDLAASACGMDKSLTKLIAAAAGVRQAAYYVAQRQMFAENPATVIREIKQKLPQFPVFIKPCSCGSSVGVHKAADETELQEGLQEAFQWDRKVLVEEFIDGHEVECAVMGNASPVASIVGEIAPTQDFYTFDAKYHDASSALYIPAHISERAQDAVRMAALRVYRALGCTGLSRVDFFCTWQGEEVVFNEINTIPGFTSISMYPKLFGAGGIAYAELLDRLIALAMEQPHDCTAALIEK